MSSDLSIECKLARDYAMENVGDTLAYLLVKLAPDASIHTETLPLNLGLIIDVSRSMKGDKIKFACESAKLLIRSLRPDDWVSVISFSDEARTIIPATQALDKASILSLIDGIRIQSGTRMFLGMDMGLREMRKAGFSNKINQVILLTDGETENEDQCRYIAERERENHVVISTLGVGKKYNELLLSQISDVSLGRFYHLSTPEQIGSILQKEVDDASVSIISEASLSLNLTQGVRLESLDRIFPGSVKLQPRSEADSRILAVDIGALKKNEPMILGVQLKLPARPAGRLKIAQLSFNYSIPSLQIEDSIENRDVFLEYTSDQSLCSKVDREVVSYFNQINAQQYVEQALTETKRGNIAGATQSLSQAQEITQRLGNLPLTEKIKEAKDELTRKGTISEDGLKTIKAGSRVTVRIDKTQLK